MNITDIDIFYNINEKKDNDKNNKIRESIIYSIIKNTIPEEWYKEDIRWLE
jgi:S-adenosylmethionine synthetase